MRGGVFASRRYGGTEAGGDGQRHKVPPSLKARTAGFPTSKYGSQHGYWMLRHARTHLELDHEMRPSVGRLMGGASRKLQQAGSGSQLQPLLN